jgi:PAS domain S-box-containing protein
MVAMMACVAVFVACSQAVADDAPKHVLVLHWFGLDALFRPGFDAALERDLRLNTSVGIDLYSETLETYRFSADPHETLMREYLRRKYAGTHLDVIVAVWDPAVAFLKKYAAELFPDVPVVFLATKAPTPEDRTAGMTGVWQHAPVSETLELIAKLHPQAKRLVVVDSTVQTGADLEAEIRARFEPFANAMTLVYLRDRTLDEVAHALTNTSVETVGLYVRQSMRTRTERMTPAAGLNAVVDVSQVPIYGMLQTMVRRGAVGGYVFYNDETSKALAGMVHAVVGGTPVRDMPPVRITGTPMFDWRALQHWHIDEKRLPAQSVVLFRPPTVWRDHHGLVLLALAIGSAQLALIAGLLFHRTRRQRVERALRKSESRTTAILRMVPDLMFVMSRDGVYLDYHARDANDLFVPPAEFLGKRMRDIFAPEMARLFEEKFAQALASDEPVIFEYSLPMPGGDRHFETHVVQCDNDTVMTIVRDVTVRHQAEEELHKAQSELAQAGRMRALGELAAGIAHEVNQPLAAIITNARAGQRALQADPANPGMAREALHDIVSDGKRASDVIARIRGLVNQEPMRRTPLAINDVIRDVVALSGRTLRQRHVELRLNLSDGLPKVRGDRVQLQQVLLNLVLNGSEAMRTVSHRTRGLGISTAQRNGHVTIAVEDSGIGLSARELGQLFTPFFTTKPEGMGVGLSISRSIVEAHGGSLKLTRNSAEGATFEFELPVLTA